MKLPELTNSLLALVFLASALNATTYTWNGDGGDNRTTNPDNWSGNQAPPHNGARFSNQSDWQFYGSTRPSPLLFDHATLRNLIFNTSTNFSLGGGSSQITLHGTIESRGSALATIRQDILLASFNSAFYATGGNLIIRGEIDSQGKDLLIDAAAGRDIVFYGGLKGGYSPQFNGEGMTKQGLGTLRWSQAYGGYSNYSAPIHLTAGTIQLETAGILSSHSDAKITVDAGATLAVKSAQTLQDDHPVELSGTLDLRTNSGWTFDQGLKVFGSAARILASENGGRGRLNATKIEMQGDHLVLEAAQGGELWLMSNGGELEIDPMGGAAVLAIGSNGGGSGEVTLYGHSNFTQASGSAGSLDAVSVSSGTLRLVSSVSLSAFENFKVHAPGSVEIVSSSPIISTSQTIQGCLSGNGDISLNDNELIVRADKQASTYSGDIYGAADSIFVKEGEHPLIVTGQINAAVNKVLAGLLELDGGQLNASTGINRETIVKTGGELAGIGQVDDLRISDAGVLRPGRLQAGVLVADRVYLENNAVLEWRPMMWSGTAGVAWPQLDANQVYCHATDANRCVIRINTDGVSGSPSEGQEFLIVDGTVYGFDTSEFEVVDQSSSPLAGTWSVRQSASPQGLALVFSEKTPYQTWIEGFGYSGNDAELDQDPDQDGIDNGIEFVLGSLPNDGTSINNPDLTVVEIDGNDFLRFTFTRNDASEYLNPMGEVSTNLTDWVDLDTIAGYYSEETVLNGTSKKIEQFIPYDPVAFPKRFVRLKVVESAP